MALMLCRFISRISFRMASSGTALPSLRMMLVAVDAFELDGCAVEQEYAVLDLDFAEAHLGWNDFQDCALRILDCQQQRVEVRRLRGPFRRVLHVQLRARPPFAPASRTSSPSRSAPKSFGPRHRAGAPQAGRRKQPYHHNCARPRTRRTALRYSHPVRSARKNREDKFARANRQTSRKIPESRHISWSSR